MRDRYETALFVGVMILLGIYTAVTALREHCRSVSDDYPIRSMLIPFLLGVALGGLLL